MAKNLRITILEPCHEDWNAMSPQAKGRHCSSCQKVVVDFSVMTDTQIIEHFKNTSTKTCGRFTTAQLNRPLPLTVGQRLFRPVKYIAASLLAIEMFSQKASAHDCIDSTNVITVQTDSVLTVNTDTVLNEPVDSCALTEIDSCATDTIASQGFELVVGDVWTQPEITITINNPPIIYGDVWPVMGICTPAEPRVSLWNDPNWLDRIVNFVQNFTGPVSGRRRAKPAELSNNYERKEQPAEEAPVRHFSFATLLKRLKVRENTV